MRNICLFLTYLGTAYHGWQVQKNLATVAETMEKAAQMIVGHPVHVTGCGRTDAGVHAKCYVANFRTSSTIPADRLPYALNTHLPVDMLDFAVVRGQGRKNGVLECLMGLEQLEDAVVIAEKADGTGYSKVSSASPLYTIK